MAELAIENITLDYGQQPVIKDLSFQLHPGELLGLVGPTGAGKPALSNPSVVF